MKKQIAALGLGSIAVLALVQPASATSGCSSWGCGTATYQQDPPSSGQWNVTVTDTLADGYCVEAWTYRKSTGVRIQRLAVSCGSTVYGSGEANFRDYGVRIFRGNGNYFTLT